MGQALERITNEEEALEYLNTISNTDNSLDKTDSLWGLLDSKDIAMIRDNEDIINKSNKILLDRLNNDDESLSIKDIIQAKSEAFKNNQVIKWLESDSIDTKKLIPTTINIQINNN